MRASALRSNIVEGEEDEESGAGSGDEEATGQSQSAGSLPSLGSSGALSRGKGSRRELLLTESVAPPETKREEVLEPSMAARRVRLTQNQLRLSTRLGIVERELGAKAEDAHEKADIDIKAAAGALQRTAQAVQATQRLLDAAFEDFLQAAADYGQSR